MKLEELERGMLVKISIPASRPILLRNGTLHSAGETYKVLGSRGTCARLSRIGDFAKIIISPSELYLA